MVITYLIFAFSIVPRNASHLETAFFWHTFSSSSVHFDWTLAIQALNFSLKSWSYSAGVLPSHEHKKITQKIQNSCFMKSPLRSLEIFSGSFFEEWSKSHPFSHTFLIAFEIFSKDWCQFLFFVPNPNQIDCCHKYQGNKESWNGPINHGRTD